MINHNFLLEFVDSGLYFDQDENNFKYPLLQVGSRPYPMKKLRIRQAKFNGSESSTLILNSGSKTECPSASVN